MQRSTSDQVAAPEPTEPGATAGTESAAAAGVGSESGVAVGATVGTEPGAVVGAGTTEGTPGAAAGSESGVAADGGAVAGTEVVPDADADTGTEVAADADADADAVAGTEVVAGADVDVRAGSGVAVGSGGRAFGRMLPWLTLVGGGVGFLAAFVLMVEKVALLRDPTYQPSCSFNPVLSCGSVMAQPQAEAFGFPNPLLGIAGFAVVMTVGAALLAGAAPRRWFWLGLQAGVTFGVVFVHWLIVQSLFRIGALCPYCMVVWVVTIPLFWYVTLHNVDRGYLPVPARARGAVTALVEYHSVPLVGWFVAVAGVILVRFWSYWSTLL